MKEKVTLSFEDIIESLYELGTVPDSGFSRRVEYSLKTSSKELSTNDQYLILNAIRYLLYNQSPQREVIGFKIFSESKSGEANFFIEAILRTSIYAALALTPQK